MAQEKFKIGKTRTSLVEVVQPDGDLASETETTYTSDSGRLKSGRAVVKPLFTVEQYSLVFSELNKSQIHAIESIIREGKKFWMHYHQINSTTWKTKQFYCGKSSSTAITLKNGKEKYTLSFNVEGVDPL